MPKIEDVAEKAGVSVTTVSRVLNNRGYISQKTRDKVYAAMKEINYQPNEMARALFRKKSNMIGLIIPSVSHPFFSELAYYLEVYADRAGYKILLCNSNRDKVKEQRYIEMLRKNQVDAIVTGSSVIEVEHYSDFDLPVISFDRTVAENIPIVTSDNIMGGKLAARLLLEKQCRKVVYISRALGGPQHQALLASGRVYGFDEEIRAAGMEPIHLELEATGTDDMQVDKLVSFLQENPDVDGVFASSDLIAAEMIYACHQLNRDIPDEIKIIGYDDVKLAALVPPGITTIKQPIEKMSERTIELIIRKLEGEEVPLLNSFPVELIERGTT